MSKAVRLLACRWKTMVAAFLLTLFPLGSFAIAQVPKRSIYKLSKISTYADEAKKELWETKENADGSVTAIYKRGSADVKFVIGADRTSATESWVDKGETHHTVTWKWNPLPKQWTADQEHKIGGVVNVKIKAGPFADGNLRMRAPVTPVGPPTPGPLDPLRWNPPNVVNSSPRKPPLDRERSTSSRIRQSITNVFS